MTDSTHTYREIAQLSAEIARCGRCGFCQSVCPVYQASPFEGSVARGRNMYAKELVSGTLRHSKDEPFFSNCLLCRACVDVCFSAVRTDEIVLAGRRARCRLLGISPAHRYVFEHLLTDHERLGKWIRLLMTAENAAAGGIRSALKTLGWLAPLRAKTITEKLERAGELVGRIPKLFLRERLLERVRTAGEGRLRAVYFVGCGTNFMFPEVGEATIELLESAGCEVDIFENACCGLPAFSHGALEAARNLAIKNIQSVSEGDSSLIVTDCSSCASFLKDYPRMLALGREFDEAMLAKAKTFSSRVRDIVEILGSEQINRGMHPSPAPRPGASRPLITLHEPCHLGRYQHLGPTARRVLKNIPAADFVEMKEADWCCGGAGTFAVEHPDMSLKILHRKVGHVKSSGATVVATTCPSCMMQLKGGLAAGNVHDSEPPVAVRHVVEIVMESAGDKT